MLSVASRPISTPGATHPAEELRRDDSDELLMQAVAKGDAAAYRSLIGRYAKKAHAVAQRLLFNRAEAEDIVQDVFIKIWVHANSWNGEKAKFSTWFYRILTNACIDSNRKKKTLQIDHAMEVADTTPSIEHDIGERQIAMQVERAIAALPERQRVALVWCYYEGLTNNQAADIMHIHIKALEGLLVRARASLRQTLAPLAGEATHA